MGGSREVYVVSVFASGPGGGNPAPIVLEATGMSDAEMQGVARELGHESAFVLPAPDDSNCDFAIRFWVPKHEMSMCGHATIGAVWLLHFLRRLPRDRVAIWTRSGRVDAAIRDPGGECVEISQPAATVVRIPDAERNEQAILKVLGITSRELAGWPIQNACTSRVKTLVPLSSVEVLDRLRPGFEQIEGLCARIGSTGLYPYALTDLTNQIVDARQFPQSSGYPEDPATGIAAAALAFGLLNNGLVSASDRPIRVRQGRAMGRPSEIAVRFRFTNGRPDGCWLGGSARFAASPHESSGAVG